MWYAWYGSVVTNIIFWTPFFLNIGVTLSNLKSRGITPCVRDWLNRVQRFSTIYSTPLLMVTGISQSWWLPFTMGIEVICGSDCASDARISASAIWVPAWGWICHHSSKLRAICFLIYILLIYILFNLCWAPLGRWMPQWGVVSRAFDTTQAWFKGSFLRCLSFFMGNPLGPTT